MSIATALDERVRVMREEFVKLTSNENPSAEDIEAAVKFDADLKTIETQLEQARRLEDARSERQRDVEEKLEAEKVAAKAGITRPRFNGSSPTEPDTGLKEWVEVAPRRLSDLLLSSKEYQQLASTVAWPQDNRRIEVPCFKQVPFRTLEQKAAGDPIMASQFNPTITDTFLDPHWVSEINVYDLIQKRPIQATSIQFYTATMPWVGGPTPVAEGALKPEIQLRWTPVTKPVETIAQWTKLTVQALSDVAGIREAVDEDLRNVLMRKVDDLLINGTGVAPEILGFWAWPGIATQIFATDAMTTIATAISTIVSAGAGSPTAILMHPTNWQTVRLTQVNGVYFWGPPTETGITRIFGIPVITNVSIPAGFALVGDFRFARIYQSMGVTFIVGWEGQDLIKNLQTIVCEIRLVLAVRRPQAFIKADIVTP
jgi:Phage capsid family